MLALTLIVPFDPIWPSINATYHCNKTLSSIISLEDRRPRAQSKIGRSSVIDETYVANFPSWPLQFSKGELHFHQCDYYLYFKVFTSFEYYTVPGTRLAFGERCCFLKKIADWLETTICKPATWSKCSIYLQLSTRNDNWIKHIKFSIRCEYSLRFFISEESMRYHVLL